MSVVEGQLFSRFKRQRADKDTVVIAMASAPGLVYAAAPPGSNIMFSGQNGGQESIQRSGQADLLGPLLKDLALPTSLGALGSMASSLVGQSSAMSGGGSGGGSTSALLEALASQLGLTKADMKLVTEFQTKMKQESPGGQAGQGPSHQNQPKQIPTGNNHNPSSAQGAYSQQQGPYNAQMSQPSMNQMSAPMPQMSSPMPQMSSSMPSPYRMNQGPSSNYQNPSNNYMTSASQQRPLSTSFPIYVPEQDGSSDDMGSYSLSALSEQPPSNMQITSESLLTSESNTPFSGSDSMAQFSNGASDQQAFRHAPNHPLDSMNQMLSNGFIRDINKIPQPFSYNHNNGLEGQAQRPRSKLLPSFNLSALPSLWSAGSSLKKTFAQWQSPVSDNRFVPTFTGLMGTSSFGGPSSNFGMPQSSGMMSQESRLVPTIVDKMAPESLEANQDGFPIIDPTSSKVLRVKHNPADILKIFADAYGKAPGTGVQPTVTSGQGSKDFPIFTKY
ncbi:hypothetical protein HDE_04272 [Halotydeus destructor]|nr:hypothetical protein HDE_04272 [Halotydeus destructor]